MSSHTWQYKEILWNTCGWIRVVSTLKFLIMRMEAHYFGAHLINSGQRYLLDYDYFCVAFSQKVYTISYILFYIRNQLSLFMSESSIFQKYFSFLPSSPNLFCHILTRDHENSLTTSNSIQNKIKILYDALEHPYPSAQLSDLT